MTRFGLVFPLIAAALALAPPARAGDAAPPTTLLGMQLALSGGAGIAPSQRAINADLQRAGWPALVGVSPAFQIRMGLTAFDVSLSLNMGGTDVSLPGKDGSPEGMEQHRKEITAELGYRAYLGRWLSVSPYVGVGSFVSSLCFAGRPDSSSATSSPAFEQILRNPGRKTCLDASAVGLDVGLTVAWNFRLASFEDMGSSLYLSVGPRGGFRMPLSSARTWTQMSSSANLAEAFPPFEGPAGPVGGAYVGLEAQIRFAMLRNSGK